MKLLGYLLLLLAFIGAMLGSVYLNSVVTQIKVTDRYVGTGKTRRGFDTDTYVLITDRGEIKLSSLPVIGYVFGAEAAYRKVQSGSTIKVRIGYWPPSWFGHQPKPEILNIYE